MLEKVHQGTGEVPEEARAKEEAVTPNSLSPRDRGRLSAGNRGQHGDE